MNPICIIFYNPTNKMHCPVYSEQYPGMTRLHRHIALAVAGRRGCRFIGFSDLEEVQPGVCCNFPATCVPACSAACVQHGGRANHECI